VTEFERLVIHYGLQEKTREELESWVYANADALKKELGERLTLELLEADWRSDSDVLEVLNPWFRQRFPDAFADTDLRQMRITQMSKRLRNYVLKSLID
jgi:hypothetical protein